MLTNWLVREPAFRRSALRTRETVFTIGNGYLSTRGAFEEGLLGDLPTTLIHGVFDDAPIVETELANAPNWLPLGLFIGLQNLNAQRTQENCLNNCNAEERQQDRYRQRRSQKSNHASKGRTSAHVSRVSNERPSG